MADCQSVVVLDIFFTFCIDSFLDICDNPVMPRENGPYKQALDETFRQLALALEKREKFQGELAALDDHITDLEEAARSVGTLCGIDPHEARPDLFPDNAEPELGFTDAVRKVFENTKDHLHHPVSVRDELKKMGFPLAKYKNPLASIHTILKRLVDQGELDRLLLDDVLRYGFKKTVAKERQPPAGESKK
jgi:hypothetical protein